MSKVLAWVVALAMLPVFALAVDSIQLRADPAKISELAAVNPNAAQLALHYSHMSAGFSVAGSSSVTMRALSRNEVQAMAAGQESPFRSDVQTVVLLVQLHPGNGRELMLRVSSADPKPGDRTFMDLQYRKDASGTYRLVGWRVL